MCGIAGIYNKKQSVDHAEFDRMVDIVSYRGPDGRGTYYDLDDHLALGHRRLAIIEPNSSGAQPFLYQDRYVLVFNGEIYNYVELKEELEQNGVPVQTKTDTEVLVAAYSFWGKDCVSHFNGMWAFAIYDKDEKTLFCSRDRFGVKPFYYLKNDRGLAFASEIKQLLSLKEVHAKADRDTFLRFLICGERDYSEKTMFEGIFSLKPGHNLCYDTKSDSSEVYRYHYLGNIKEIRSGFEKDGEDFKKLFLDSVRLRLRSDVPLGYCLSGGLDSSSIVCSADHILAGTPGCEKHAVSSCFEDPDYDEREYIDEVVQATDVVPHQVFPDINQVLDEMDKMVFHMDEPILSTSFYSQWNVFREARKQNLTVMLDGQGSDEQLAGYGMFYSVRFAELIKKFRFITLYREFTRYLNRCRTQFRDVRLQSVVLSTLFAVVPIPGYFRYMIRARRMKKANPFFTDKLLNQVYRHYNSYDAGNTRRYTEDNIYQCLQENFHDEDRISMAYSIESRVPFMDFKLVERVFSMPFDSKIRDGITKAVLREGLKDILPDKIVHRYSKLGFASPEDKWMNENPELIGRELEKACEDLKPLLDKEVVMSWYKGKAGKIERGNYVIWRILSAASWIRVFDVTI